MKRTVAIVDSRIGDEAERALTLRGFTVIKLPPYKRLSEAVASHADMLVHKIGNKIISYADYCYSAPWVFSDLSELLLPSGYTLSLADEDVAKEYPRDCGLNALRMGDKLFLRREGAAKMLIAAAEELKLEIINTRQGYPACTVLKLSENAAITADEGMARVLSENGIYVTLIENGGISLPPYDYGFIGGCGGVYGDKLYLFGNPELHRSRNALISAIEAAGLTAVPLDCGELRDLGGIIFADYDVK